MAKRRSSQVGRMVEMVEMTEMAEMAQMGECSCAMDFNFLIFLIFSPDRRREEVTKGG